MRKDRCSLKRPERMMEVCRRQSCLHHCPCSAHHQSPPVHSVWDDYVHLACQPNQLDTWWQVRGQTRCYSLLEVQKKHNMTVMSNSQLIIVFLILAHGQMLNVMGVFFFVFFISRFSDMKNSQHNYNWMFLREHAGLEWLLVLVCSCTSWGRNDNGSLICFLPSPLCL